VISPELIDSLARAWRKTSQSVQKLQQLRVVVAEVQGIFPVLGGERSAHPLGIARPLAQHLADVQAHRVADDAALGLVVASPSSGSPARAMVRRPRPKYQPRGPSSRHSRT